MLSGPEVIRLRDALVKAFSPDDLLELVLVCFNEDLEKIVAPGPLNKRALDLVRWADHRGIVPDLARGAFLARPRDTTLRELQDVYEGAPRLSIQTAGAARRVTASALEAIVRPRLKSVDMDVWRERYASVEGQVCRIEIDGAAEGHGISDRAGSRPHQFPCDRGGHRGTFACAFRDLPLRLQAAH